MVMCHACLLVSHDMSRGRGRVGVNLKSWEQPLKERWMMLVVWWCVWGDLWELRHSVGRVALEERLTTSHHKSGAWGWSSKSCSGGAPP